MEAVKTLMTAEDLLHMPKDDMRYELVDGELITMSPTKLRHGVIASRIDRRLGTYVEAHDLGEVLTAEAGFVMQRDPDHVRAPDVAFIAREHLPAEEEWDDYGERAPDLAVEVISPDDKVKDIQTKVAEYFAAGAQLLWLVYPWARQVMVYRSPTDVQVLTEEDELDGGDVLPGFTCPLAAIFG